MLSRKPAFGAIGTGVAKERTNLSNPPTSTAFRLLAVALLALSAGAGAVRAAESAKAADAAKRADAKGAVAAAKERAKKGGTSALDIRKLYEELSKQRDLMIADFDVLAKQMKDATEEQKKQIKEKMEAQKKAFEIVTSALHKQIREEQRKERQNAAPAKR
jgi:hypothetical protein